MKMFQIYEDDLVELEHTLPQLADALAQRMNNRLRVQLSRVQKILSAVRWNYGPMRNVHGTEEEEFPR